MAYNFDKADNEMIIQEMQYGTGERIQFSPFSSCLGVVGRTGTNVTGIHLVEYDRHGVRFNDEMATAVKTKLNGCEEWIFMGFVDDWLRTFPNEMNIIKSMPNEKQSVKGSDGVYGAKAEYREFAYLKAPKYIRVT